MRLHHLLALSLLIGVQGQTTDSNRTSKLGAPSGPKPHLVVFLTNTKIIDHSDNQTDRDYVNPFQRMIQFFLSNILRDFSIERNETLETSTVRDKKDLWGDIKEGTANFTNKAYNETKKGFEATKKAFMGAAVIMKDIKRSSDEERCLHGEVGFCKSCSRKVDKRKVENPAVNETTEKSKKRHYFLSISGDTDKRVAASPQNPSTSNQNSISPRVRRASTPSNPRNFPIPKTTNPNYPGSRAAAATQTRSANQVAEVPTADSITSHSANQDSGIEAGDATPILFTNQGTSVAKAVLPDSANQDPKIGIVKTVRNDYTNQPSRIELTVNPWTNQQTRLSREGMLFDSANSRNPTSKLILIDDNLRSKNKSAKTESVNSKRKFDLTPGLAKLQMEDIDFIDSANQDSRIRRSGTVSNDSSNQGSKFGTVREDSTNQQTSIQKVSKDSTNYGLIIQRAEVVATDSSKQKSSSNLQPNKFFNTFLTDSTKQLSRFAQAVASFARKHFRFPNYPTNNGSVFQRASPSPINSANPGKLHGDFHSEGVDESVSVDRQKRIPQRGKGRKGTDGVKMPPADGQTTMASQEGEMKPMPKKPKPPKGKPQGGKRRRPPAKAPAMQTTITSEEEIIEATTTADDDDEEEGAGSDEKNVRPNEDDLNPEEDLSLETEPPMGPPNQVVRPKVKAEYSSFTYFLTVTLPTVIFFAAVIIGMCFVFRTNGFCCKLFLTIPSENQARKKRVRKIKVVKVKRRKKKKEQEQIVLENT